MPVFNFQLLAPPNPLFPQVNRPPSTGNGKPSDPPPKPLNFNVQGQAALSGSKVNYQPPKGHPVPQTTSKG